MITGNIMWFSEKDGNGIILGDDNREYYFDTSVWKCPVSNPFSDRLVRFETRVLTGCNCAYNVRDFLAKDIK